MSAIAPKRYRPIGAKPALPASKRFSIFSDQFAPTAAPANGVNPPTQKPVARSG
ncbi:hypothetical protein G4G27_23790 [Sphingomonas sp. So64.6b]|nr:hypothetical protein G4G27_23790 [Sphingomonas sp. So64.6b]